MRSGALCPRATQSATRLRTRSRRRCVTRAASDVASQGTYVRAATHWSELKEPVHIWATGDKSIRIQNYGGEVSLAKYMTLPVHQYYVLDPHLITSLGDDSFEFNVPKMQIFNEWIQPNVVAQVEVTPGGVHILTKECSMQVSEMIETLKLDQQWHMIFESTLTWDDDCSESDRELRGFERVLAGTNGASAEKTYGMMHGKSRVDVWCELAPGFTFMPPDVLQNACNFAMDTLMQGLLPIFMTQLSEDYKKWATDESYRDDRMTWNIERFKQKNQ